MWTKSHTVVTQAATKEQLWKLFANVNQWHQWDTGIEYAKLEGKFEKGNFFELKPKGGPKLKIQLLETIENKKFVDCTTFPLAKMTGTHTFQESPEGLIITTTMAVTGLLSFLWVKLVAQKIADSLPLEMPEQIKYAATL